MSISRQIDKKAEYIYTMEYYSAIKKNAFESVLIRWMKLEPIIKNEVSQKEKHQYINTYMQMIPPLWQKLKRN